MGPNMPGKYRPLVRGSRGPSTVTLMALLYVATYIMTVITFIAFTSVATCIGLVMMVIVMVKLLPRPLRPTNLRLRSLGTWSKLSTKDSHLRSENLASWFFMTAVQFLISPPQLSSLPHFTETRVPSGTSWTRWRHDNMIVGLICLSPGM